MLKQRKNITTKIISTFVLLSFLISICKGFTFPLPLKLPVPVPSYGTVTQEFVYTTKSKPNKPFIYIIQDIHCNKQAHISIKKIIEQITSHSNFLNSHIVIGTEGDFQKIDVSVLNNIENKKVKQQIIDYFLDKGYLKGVELYLAENKNPVPAYGIEDKNVYLQNFNVLHKSLNRDNTKIFTTIRKLQAMLNQAKPVVYPKKIKQFEHKKQVLDNFAYTKYIYNVGKKLGLKCREVEKYIKIEARSQKLEVRREINRILNSGIKNYLNKKEIEILRSLRGKAYYQYLKELVKAKNIKIPELNKYFKYLDIKIDNVKLLHEKQELEYKVKQSLIKGFIQSNQILYSEKYLNLLKKLVKNELTSKEVEEWKQGNKKFFKTIKKLEKRLSNKQGLVKTLKQEVKNIQDTSEEFYKLAEKRNEILVAKMLSRIQNSDTTALQHYKTTTLNHNSIGIMIVGGYHTDGITKILRSRGIGYKVIIPNVQEIGNSKEIYERRLEEQARYLQNNQAPRKLKNSKFQDTITKQLPITNNQIPNKKEYRSQKNKILNSKFKTENKIGLLRYARNDENDARNDEQGNVIARNLPVAAQPPKQFKIKNVNPNLPDTKYQIPDTSQDALALMSGTVTGKPLIDAILKGDINTFKKEAKAVGYTVRSEDIRLLKKINIRELDKKQLLEAVTLLATVIVMQVFMSDEKQEEHLERLRRLADVDAIEQLYLDETNQYQLRSKKIHLVKQEIPFHVQDLDYPSNEPVIYKKDNGWYVWFDAKEYNLEIRHPNYTGHLDMDNYLLSELQHNLRYYLQKDKQGNFFIGVLRLRGGMWPGWGPPPPVPAQTYNPFVPPAPNSSAQPCPPICMGPPQPVEVQPLAPIPPPVFASAYNPFVPPAPNSSAQPCPPICMGPPQPVEVQPLAPIPPPVFASAYNPFVPPAAPSTYASPAAPSEQQQYGPPQYASSPPPGDWHTPQERERLEEEKNQRERGEMRHGLILARYIRSKMLDEQEATRNSYKGVFLADPYHLENFESSLENDIKTITGTHEIDVHGQDQEAKNNKWFQMPCLLIIPFLSGRNWRAVRVEINYDSKNVSILWDDPTGRAFFDEPTRAKLTEIIRKQAQILLTQQLGDQTIEFVIEYTKPIDQQDSINYGCVPIVFGNINDYVDRYKGNEDFTADVVHKKEMVDFRTKLISRFRTIIAEDTEPPIAPQPTVPQVSPKPVPSVKPQPTAPQPTAPSEEEGEAEELQRQQEAGRARLEKLKEERELSSCLARLSERGDDQSLDTQGENVDYWYSMYDGIVLAKIIRQEKFQYQNDNHGPYRIEAEGAQYSSTRENSRRVFLADPYHLENFAMSLEDDMKTITGTHEQDGHGQDQKAKNNRWLHMPRLLIIPFLAGVHWRVIRVEIDYTNKRISILWDDPFGGDSFDENIKINLEEIIREQAQILLRQQPGNAPILLVDDRFVEEYFKRIKQQDNGYDCGPIVFGNIADYVDIHKQNVGFAAGADEHYSITKADNPGHGNQMIGVRARHVSRFRREIGSSKDQDECNIRSVIQSYGTASEPNYIRLCKNILRQKYGNVDFNLVQRVLEVIIQNRLVIGEHIGEPCTDTEFVAAYELLTRTSTKSLQPPATSQSPAAHESGEEGEPEPPPPQARVQPGLEGEFLRARPPRWAYNAVRMDRMPDYIASAQLMYDRVMDWMRDEGRGKPSKDLIREVKNWLKSLRPIHRCKSPTLQSIVNTGGLLSRSVLDGMFNKSSLLMESLAIGYPSVLKHLSRENLNVVQEYVKALVALNMFVTESLRDHDPSIPLPQRVKIVERSELVAAQEEVNKAQKSLIPDMVMRHLGGTKQLNEENSDAAQGYVNAFIEFISLKIELKRLRKVASKYNGELETRNKDLRSTKERVDKATEECETLEIELAELSKDVDIDKAVLQDRQEQLRSAKQQVDAANKSHTQAVAALDGVSHKAREHEKSLDLEAVQEKLGIAQQNVNQAGGSLIPDLAQAIERTTNEIMQDFEGMTGKTIAVVSGGKGAHFDQVMGTSGQVFAVLGPHNSREYGDITLVFKEILNHPYCYVLPCAASLFFNGKHAVGVKSAGRPWVTGVASSKWGEPTRVELRKSRLHPMAPMFWDALAAELIARTIFAPVANAETLAIVAEQRVTEAITEPEKIATAAAAAVEKAKNEMKKSSAISLNDVRAWWDVQDPHLLPEVHMPPVVPLGYVSAVLMPRDQFDTLPEDVSRVLKKIVGDKRFVVSRNVKDSFREAKNLCTGQPDPLFGLSFGLWPKSENELDIFPPIAFPDNEASNIYFSTRGDFELSLHSDIGSSQASYVRYVLHVQHGKARLLQGRKGQEMSVALGDQDHITLPNGNMHYNIIYDPTAKKLQIRAKSSTSCFGQDGLINVTVTEQMKWVSIRVLEGHVSFRFLPIGMRPEEAEALLQRSLEVPVEVAAEPVLLQLPAENLLRAFIKALREGIESRGLVMDNEKHKRFLELEIFEHMTPMFINDIACVDSTRASLREYRIALNKGKGKYVKGRKLRADLFVEWVRTVNVKNSSDYRRILNSILLELVKNFLRKSENYWKEILPDVRRELKLSEEAVVSKKRYIENLNRERWLTLPVFKSLAMYFGIDVTYIDLREERHSLVDEGTLKQKRTKGQTGNYEVVLTEVAPDQFNVRPGALEQAGSPADAGAAPVPGQGRGSSVNGFPDGVTPEEFIKRVVTGARMLPEVPVVLGGGTYRRLLVGILQAAEDTRRWIVMCNPEIPEPALVVTDTEQGRTLVFAQQRERLMDIIFSFLPEDLRRLVVNEEIRHERIELAMQEARSQEPESRREIQELLNFIDIRDIITPQQAHDEALKQADPRYEQVRELVKIFDWLDKQKHVFNIEQLKKIWEQVEKGAVILNKLREENGMQRIKTTKLLKKFPELLIAMNNYEGDEQIDGGSYFEMYRETIEVYRQERQGKQKIEVLTDQGRAVVVWKLYDFEGKLVDVAIVDTIGDGIGTHLVTKVVMSVARDLPGAAQGIIKDLEKIFEQKFFASERDLRGFKQLQMMLAAV